jgi:hypothetical protein
MGQSINSQELKELEIKLSNNKCDSFIILILTIIILLYIYLYNMYSEI